jgi:hypothetical protein
MQTLSMKETNTDAERGTGHTGLEPEDSVPVSIRYSSGKEKEPP